METTEDLVTTDQAEDKLKDAGSPRMHQQLDEDIVNPIELARALGIRPQQVYNDIRNGRLVSVRHNNTQKMVIAWSDAVEYARRRFERELKRELKREAELAGEAA